MPTSEHILPLLVVYNRPRFQVLRLQPVGDRNRFWFWRSRLNRLLLSPLLRLHLRLLLGLLLSHCLLSQSLDVFLN